MTWAAGFSFTLYLMHVPLILFMRSLGIYDPRSWVQGAMAAMVLLFLCFAFAEVTEHRKKFWRDLIGQLSAIASAGIKGRVKRA